MEEWKDIKGYEGLYQVSNKGMVKSLEREYIGGCGAVRHLKEKIMKPIKTKNDYLHIKLSKNGVVKCFYIHVLVAQEFIPNPNGYTEINHKSEDKTLNTVENLEWCDRLYNNNYGTRNNRISNANTNNPKISKEVYQCTMDGKLIKIYPSSNECERNGYSQTDVNECCNGKRKSHKGFKWMFKDNYDKSLEDLASQELN